MSEQIYLNPTWEQFVEKYQPVKNHLDENASMDGFMYETYGEELKHVQDADPNKIFTVLDCDGCTYIGSGFHFVNRMGYLLVSKAVPENTYVEIQDDPECDPGADDEEDAD